MPFLSVIVPVYQTEKYLHQCIDSILNQEFRDFELILVDDGSKDRCPEICDEYAGKDPRVRVLHKPNGGSVSARKAGTEIAAGEYITYVDSDDFLTEGYAELYSIVQKEHPDVLCTRFILHDKKGQSRMEEAISSGMYDRAGIEKLQASLPYHKRLGSFGLLPSCSNKWFRADLAKKWQLREPENITIGDDLAVAYPSIFEAQKLCVTEIENYHVNSNEESYTRKYVGADVEIRRVDALYEYLVELSKESFGKAVAHQMDLYRIRLMITAFEKEYSKSNDSGFFAMFSKVHRIMKNYGGYVKQAYLPEDIEVDYNFRHIVGLWKAGLFFLADVFLILRKIEKKTGLLK